MFDLLRYLSRFDSRGDLETDTAYLRTQLPAIGPLAYLAVVYKPADPIALAVLTEDLTLPPQVVQTLRMWNGASLFHIYLHIFGCLAPTQLLSRHDPLARLPFNLRWMNEERMGGLAKLNLVLVGAYGYDTSLVCVERESGQVVVTFGDVDDYTRYRARWPSFLDWMESEIPRLGACFDKRGSLLVPEEWTVPGGEKGH